MSIDRAIDRLNEAGRTDLAEAVSDLMRSAERLALERAEFRRDAEKWKQKAEHWMAAYVTSIEMRNAAAAQSAGEKP